MRVVLRLLPLNILVSVVLSLSSKCVWSIFSSTLDVHIQRFNDAGCDPVLLLRLNVWFSICRWWAFNFILLPGFHWEMFRELTQRAGTQGSCCSSEGNLNFIQWRDVLKGWEASLSEVLNVALCLTGICLNTREGTVAPMTWKEDHTPFRSISERALGKLLASGRVGIGSVSQVHLSDWTHALVCLPSALLDSAPLCAVGTCQSSWLRDHSCVQYLWTQEWYCVTYTYMTSGLTTRVDNQTGLSCLGKTISPVLRISQLSIVLGLGLRPRELFSFLVSLSIAVILVLTIQLIPASKSWSSCHLLLSAGPTVALATLLGLSNTIKATHQGEDWHLTNGHSSIPRISCLVGHRGVCIHVYFQSLGLLKRENSSTLDLFI